MYTKSRRQFNRRPHFNTARRTRAPQKQYIDPSRFIKPGKAVSEIAPAEPAHRFEDFDLNPTLKKNIARVGFTVPTPIQDKTIPHALLGKDVLGIADTGTGKTAAFALPILHSLLADRRAKALVVAPTRELAQQIESEFRMLGAGTGLRAAVLIGGKPMSPQIRDLNSRPSLVIGTPGRIKDHLERTTLRLESFAILVLDEVDRMLDMGFINDIRFILKALASKRQSYFFSATIDRRIEGLIDGFLNDPFKVSVKTGDTTENVAQDVLYYVTPQEKIDKLHDALIHESARKTLIFEETKRGVDRLHKELRSRGFDAEMIHGGKSQGQRQRALARFKQNEVNVLVATDVAARGIDVPDITHVINYTPPNTYDDYIHRVGRAGRAGQTGQALTFVRR